MIYFRNDSGAFEPATTAEQGRHAATAFAIIANAARRIAPRHGIRADADGIAMGVRLGDKRWTERWSDLQSEILRDGAERAIRDVQRVRADAFTATGSAFGSQDLIANYGRVFEEIRPPKKYRETFAVSNEVPLGANQYRLRKISSTGEAQIYRAGLSVSLVDVGMAEELRPVNHYVAAFEMNWLMGAGGGIAGIDLNGRLLAAAQDAIEYVYDEIAFLGAGDMLGLKNYPGIARYTSSTALASVTAQQLADFYIEVLRRPAQNSKTALSPNVLEVAPEIFTVGSRLKFTDTGESVNEWLVKQRSGTGQPYELRESWRLTDFGGSGVHGAFAHGTNASTLQIEATPTLVIPGPASEWSQTTYVVGQFGGAINPYPVGMEIGLIAAS